MPDRVLIVDDDTLVLDALSRCVRAAGFEAASFADPYAALETLAASPPVVIISDYMMPGLDGIAFLREARVRVPDAARILCTAVDEFAVAMQAVNSGEIYRLLGKPWRNADVAAAVSQAAAFVRLRRENERLSAENQRQNDLLRTMNAQLESMVRERTANLLDGLVAALDYRDAKTQWHSRRVARYACRLGQQLGISGDELADLERGALLHDIGKIGVQDRVLLKPGSLTAEEWVEMKRHARLGWALLQQIEYLRPAAVIVLQHQEQWDGSGYPAGLKGTQIALGARIFNVVDAFDAITSDRPYREARPFADARAEIAAGAGKSFDPTVVEAFLAVPEEDWTRLRAEVEAVALLASELAEPDG